MSHPSNVLPALLIGFLVAGFAPPPAGDAAQITDARIAAIVKCTKVAHTRYPDDGYAQHRGRYQAYAECMADAGEAP